MSFLPTDSVGTQVNRALDRLGLPDSFGDKIGALVDLQRGDLRGAVRNLVDLHSGLSTSQMDRAIAGRPNPSFGCGFVPRHTCGGSHLERYRHTYTTREQVGKNAHVGQRYQFGWGPFQCQGRITGRQYCGSFAKPIRLGNNEWLYRGRTYASLGDIYKDARDGRVDGQATTKHTVEGYRWVPNQPFCPPSLGNLPNLPFFPNPIHVAVGAGAAAGSAVGAGIGAIGDILGRILGGIANGGCTPNAPSAPAPGASNGGGVDDEADKILSSNASMEDKLLALMAKLSKHLDEQIENQMKKIEKEMAKQKQGEQGGANGAGGSSGGGIGGFFKSVAGIAGGIAGTAFGGPLGGMVGSQLGNVAGGVIGGALDGNGGSNGAAGANGGGSSSSTDKSNLQLLQTQLQQMVDRRNQMFQTMSQMLKSLGETSMAAIRNLKA